ncbi:MAG TPA: NAD(P)/FAD-dependent oxidoreductase [Thermoanaerobaculia bacterium]|nr:NAD(P)/FAD-dependent oxidoreductase [Thermoanaerobaculia bacterium]
MRVAVIGSGIGGLAAAIGVAAAGHDVTIYEARSDTGGLAGSVEADGLTFDAGPYVLLDRPGLEWAFGRLGVAVPPLDRLDEVVYEVSWPDGETLHVYADIDRTARELGPSYPDFVARMAKRYAQLAPMLRVSCPNPFTLVRHGALGAAPFLLRSLAAVMRQSGLRPRAVEALTIWTHIAGQSLATAPSPMAFVPALIHEHGAWVPRGGTSAIARALHDAAVSRGVRFRFGARVTGIVAGHGIRIGDELIEADAVISNHSAAGSYVDLLDVTPARKRDRLRKLPLQSPGSCAYMRITPSKALPYLRFRLGGNFPCRVLVARGETARLILPNSDSLDAALAEPWWRDGIERADVLLKRTPRQWGSEYTLYRDSMNVVMTRTQMRRGRIAHRSPDARGLYLAGSSTHPGQWISFCAISGVLAAEALIEDRC